MSPLCIGRTSICVCIYTCLYIYIYRDCMIYNYINQNIYIPIYIYKYHYINIYIYIKILQYIIHVGTVGKHLAASRTGQARDTNVCQNPDLKPSQNSSNCGIHNLLIPHNINLLIVIFSTHQKVSYITKIEQNNN